MKYDTETLHASLRLYVQNDFYVQSPRGRGEEGREDKA
jgi:hypothetical protein